MTAPAGFPQTATGPLVHLTYGDGQARRCEECYDDLFHPRTAAGVLAYFCRLCGEQYHEAESGAFDGTEEPSDWEMWARRPMLRGTVQS